MLDSWELVIINISEGYLNKGLSIQELMSIGRAGLKRCIEIDKDKLGRRITDRFGAWWIKQSMLKLVLSQKNNT